MEFCKAFNAHTQNQEQGVPIPTVITVYADRSFSFETKTPAGLLFHQTGREARFGFAGAGACHGGRCPHVAVAGNR